MCRTRPDPDRPAARHVLSGEDSTILKRRAFRIRASVIILMRGYHIVDAARTPAQNGKWYNTGDMGSLPIKHILVVFSKFDQTHRQMLGGILRYARDNCAHNWTAQLELMDTSRRTSADVTNGKIDGIIAAVDNPSDRRKYLSAGIPIVLYEPTIAKWDHSRRPEHSVTYFNDHAAEGRTAAEYFIQRGFRHFAYVGTSAPIAWNEARRRGFVSTLSEKGFGCSVYRPSPTAEKTDFVRETNRIARWLAKLPHGTALFAVHDERAQQISSIAKLAGIPVPERIAILGVDDDVLLCTTSSPTLSSIPVNAAETGYRFARSLDDLLHGIRKDPVIRTCHTHVITRQSTDVSIIDDPFVSRAVEFMRRHLDKSIGGTQMAEAARCSLRTLQMRTRAALGRTLKDELAYLRRTEAVSLLANTSMSVEQIARACGYCGASHLGLHLKRHLGVKPLDLRRRT